MFFYVEDQRRTGYMAMMATRKSFPDFGQVYASEEIPYQNGPFFGHERGWTKGIPLSEGETIEQEYEAGYPLLAIAEVNGVRYKICSWKDAREFGCQPGSADKKGKPGNKRHINAYVPK